MRSSAIFVAIAATAVSAQGTVPTYKSSLNMTIDPNTVPQQQRGKAFCFLFFSVFFFCRFFAVFCGGMLPIAGLCEALFALSVCLLRF